MVGCGLTAEIVRGRMWREFVSIARRVRASLARLGNRRSIVRWGNLRRTSPISRVFGLDRGTAIDRYYIERFLREHSADVRGAVLEVGDRTYTEAFGGGSVDTSDVLHVEGRVEGVTVVADLMQAESLEPDEYDCFICTQTLQCVFDVQAAIRTAHHILKPGGVLLATVPCISQISRYDMDRWGDYWRFTSLAVRRMLEEEFSADDVYVETHGNVLVAAALIYGLAADELSTAELGVIDPDYEVVITARAVKR